MYSEHYAIHDFRNMELFKNAPPEWHSFVQKEWEVFAYGALYDAPLFVQAWLFNFLDLRDEFHQWRQEHTAITRKFEDDTAQHLQDWFSAGASAEMIVVYQRRFKQLQEGYQKARDECWKRYYEMVIAKIEAANLLQK